MVSQQDIPLDQEIVMQEFIIDHSTPIPETVSKPTGEGQSLEFFPKTYYNERLIEGRFPLIDYGRFQNLEQIAIELTPKQYKVPKEFLQFTKKILIKRRGSASNGRIISVGDMLMRDDSTPMLLCRPSRYYRLIQTNLAQDVDMSQYDSNFSPGTTWRSLEVDDGRAIPLSSSGMVNQLCLSYIILTEDEGHMIAGMRRSNLAVEGGTIGLLGSSPHFSEEFLKGNETFAENLRNYVGGSERGGLAKELCLQKGEYLLKGGFAMRDLMRGANLFIVYVLRGVSPEALAERCSVSEDAQEQHARLYVVPFTLEAIASLEKGSSGYSMNLGTLGSCYYALKQR